MKPTSVLVAGLLMAATGPAAAQAAGTHGADIDAGKTAAAAWLLLVDGARYQASWDSAAAPLRQAVSPAEADLTL